VRTKFVPFKSVIKPILFVPNIVAIVAASLVFQNLFGTEYGVINWLIGMKIPWLQDYGLARWVVVVVLVWRNVGFWFVVFLAGLTSISPEIEDAARVDGATTWQRLRFITIPLMRNISSPSSSTRSTRSNSSPSRTCSWGGPGNSPTSRWRRSSTCWCSICVAAISARPRP
jgi:ABC-type sugar transport system permease subunit